MVYRTVRKKIGRAIAKAEDSDCKHILKKYDWFN